MPRGCDTAADDVRIAISEEAASPDTTVVAAASESASQQPPHQLDQRTDVTSNNSPLRTTAGHEHDLQMVVIHLAPAASLGDSTDTRMAAAASTGDPGKPQENTQAARSLSTLDVSRPPVYLSTRRRSQWDSLPAEMLSLICEFADAQTLCRLARVDTFTRSVADRPASWRHAVSKQEYPFYLSADTTTSEFLGVSRQDAKRFYAARYQGAIDIYMCRLRKHDFDREVQQRQVRSWWCLCFSDVLLLPILAALFLAFFIVLVVQLTQSESVTIATFIPLYVIGIILAPLACFLGQKRWCEEDDDGFFAADHYAQSEGCVKNTMQCIGNDGSPIAHVSFCGMLLALMLFIVLLSMRVTDRVDWSWWVIFTPLYVVFAICICGPHLEWSDEDDWDDESMLPAPNSCLFFTLLSPFLVFVVLLNVRLSGGDDALRLVYVLTPLFFVDFLLLLCTVAMIFIGQDSVCTTVLTLMMWIGAVGPFVVFKVLLVLRVDGGFDSSFAIIFLPLYFTMIAILANAGWIAKEGLEGLPLFRRASRVPCPWLRPRA